MRDYSNQFIYNYFLNLSHFFHSYKIKHTTGMEDLTYMQTTSLYISHKFFLNTDTEKRH